MYAHDKVMVMRSSRDVERKQKEKQVVDRQLLPNGLYGYLDENIQGSNQVWNKEKKKDKTEKKLRFCARIMQRQVSVPVTSQFLLRN